MKINLRKVANKECVNHFYSPVYTLQTVIAGIRLRSPFNGYIPATGTIFSSFRAGQLQYIPQWSEVLFFVTAFF